jgi:trimeric autotransporter adhesin
MNLTRATYPSGDARRGLAGLRTLLLLGFLSLLSACGGGSGPSTPTLTSISVGPPNASAAAGLTQSFEATGSYSDGSKQDLSTQVTWSSSNSAVATITMAAASAGLATLLQPGTTTITATLNGMSGSASLTVSAATLVSIGVTPMGMSVASGLIQAFKATGVYSDHSMLDLTAAVTWSSSAPSIASISNTSGSNGFATAAGSGSTVIMATLGSVSGSTSLTVTAATLASIGVTPANPTLPTGLQQSYTATGVYTDGSMHDLTGSVVWTSSSPSVGSISNTAGSIGRGTAVGPGSTTITATLGTVSGSTTLTVTAATLVSIAVTPPNLSIPRGLSPQFTATGTYTDNSTRNLTTKVTWSSSDISVATVSNASGFDGLGDAVSPGTVTVTATLGAISGSTGITVTSATLVSIGVTPANPNLAKGTSTSFTATGVYTDNSTQNLTSSAAWTSSDTTIASISNASGSNGMALAVATGSVTITASLGSVSGNTSLTVTAATLVSISVTPAAPSIALGTAQQFTATGTYTDNTTQNLTTQVTWASGTASNATISNASGSQGLASSSSVGTSTITATLGAVSGSTSLTVTAASLASIAVAPANPSIALGTTQQFTATGTYTDQSTQNLTTSVTWGSSTSNASISNASGSQGLASSFSVGSSTISATFGGLSGSTALTVTPATLVSIAVTPSGPSIPAAGTEQFIATGTYTDNSTQILTTSVTWASSDVNIAAISNAAASQGLAVGLVVGSTSISAGVGSVTSPTVTLTVTAQVESTLYSFTAGTDGQFPRAGLIQGADGNFYGTTYQGGTNSNGTVFKITSAGVETVLYSFTAGTDGVYPRAGLIQGTDGNFYGTTSAGGASGYGTVFKLTPAGAETVLYSFTGGTDGGFPYAGLIQGADGNFYGTTYQGGTNGNGTVFKLTPAGAETVLYSFAGGTDGQYPQAGLIQGTDGNFYGTTLNGGTNAVGTVFKLTPAGAETVLYSFAGGTDGGNPFAGLILGADGNFYGTTFNGGQYGDGTVFKITSAGAETVLWSFGSSNDAMTPYAGLIQGADGNFYGTTLNGGTVNAGAVFKITPAGAETVVYSFTAGTDGANPYAGLIQGTDGSFYGTTNQTGANGDGTVFKF